MHRIWNIPTRRYFKRDHEKLIVADDTVFLGSANISIDYARRPASPRQEARRELLLRPEHVELERLPREGPQLHAARRGLARRRPREGQAEL
jgi:hypothetical protein